MLITPRLRLTYLWAYTKSDPAAAIVKLRT